MIVQKDFVVYGFLGFIASINDRSCQKSGFWKTISDELFRYMLLKHKYESIKDKTVMVKFPIKGLKEAMKMLFLQQ